MCGLGLAAGRRGDAGLQDALQSKEAAEVVAAFFRTGGVSALWSGVGLDGGEDGSEGYIPFSGVS